MQGFGEKQKEQCKERRGDSKASGGWGRHCAGTIISWLSFLKHFWNFRKFIPSRKKSGVAASSLISMANCGKSRCFISSCYCQRRGHETPFTPSFLSRQHVLLIEHIFPSWNQDCLWAPPAWWPWWFGKEVEKKTIYSGFHASLTFFFTENSKRKK